MERAHALDAIRRTQAWFDRHLRSVDWTISSGPAVARSVPRCATAPRLRTAEHRSRALPGL